MNDIKVELVPIHIQINEYVLIHFLEDEKKLALARTSPQNVYTNIIRDVPVTLTAMNMRYYMVHVTVEYCKTGTNNIHNICIVIEKKKSPN